MDLNIDAFYTDILLWRLCIRNSLSRIKRNSVRPSDTPTTQVPATGIHRLDINNRRPSLWMKKINTTADNMTSSHANLDIRELMISVNIAPISNPPFSTPQAIKAL